MNGTVNANHLRKLLARAEGALVAFAASDALGWPQEMPRYVRRGSNLSPQVEFHEWTRRSGGRYQPYEEIIEPGDYSDDTQLMLAVARTRTKYADSWWKALTRIELPLWTLYQRGAGRATLRAANSWVRGASPWQSTHRNERWRYFNAGGNGVAMRVLPHSVFHAQNSDWTSLIQDVLLDGTATHGHPRALIGASLYAYAAWLLLRRETTLRFGELIDQLISEVSRWSIPPASKLHVDWLEQANLAMGIPYLENWDATTHQMLYLLALAHRSICDGALSNDHELMKNLGCFGRENGSGTITSAAAVYLVSRHAAQPRQGILRAAFENGADTDTLAAMVGGLGGCLAGTDWLPQPWWHVQDATYIRTVARQLLEGPKHTEHKELQPFTDPKRALAQIAEIESEREINLADREVKVSRIANPMPLAKSIVVHAWNVETKDGQTFKVTETKKILSNTSRTTRNESGYSADKDRDKDPNTTDMNQYSEDLYALFRRRLEDLLERSNSMTTKEITDALGIVQSQAEHWISRGKQEGWILQISKNPKRFTLKANQLLL